MKTESLNLNTNRASQISRKILNKIAINSALYISSNYYFYSIHSLGCMSSIRFFFIIVIDNFLLTNSDQAVLKNLP